MLADFGGPNALSEWTQLNEALRAVQELSVAIPPLCLRCDTGALLTLAPHFGNKHCLGLSHALLSIFSLPIHPSDYVLDDAERC